MKANNRLCGSDSSDQITLVVGQDKDWCTEGQGALEFWVKIKLVQILGKSHINSFITFEVITV